MTKETEETNDPATDGELSGNTGFSLGRGRAGHKVTAQLLALTALCLSVPYSRHEYILCREVGT